MGSRPISGVGITRETCPAPVDPTPPPVPRELTCPWVKSFGEARVNCEPIPCCCQFDPVTKRAKTDCPGGCPAAQGDKDSCKVYLEERAAAAAAAATTSSQPKQMSTPVLLSPIKINEPRKGNK